MDRNVQKTLVLTNKKAEQKSCFRFLLHERRVTHHPRSPIIQHDSSSNCRWFVSRHLARCRLSFPSPFRYPYPPRAQTQKASKLKRCIPEFEKNSRSVAIVASIKKVVENRSFLPGKGGRPLGASVLRQLRIFEPLGPQGSERMRNCRRRRQFSDDSCGRAGGDCATVAKKLPPLATVARSSAAGWGCQAAG